MDSSINHLNYKSKPGKPRIFIFMLPCITVSLDISKHTGHLIEIFYNSCHLNGFKLMPEKGIANCLWDTISKYSLVKNIKGILILS